MIIVFFKKIFYYQTFSIELIILIFDKFKIKFYSIIIQFFNNLLLTIIKLISLLIKNIIHYFISLKNTHLIVFY